MSEDPAELGRIANKMFGNLMIDGFLLFFKNWLKIIVPMGLIFIISMILREVVFIDLQWNLTLLEISISPILDADPSGITPEELQLLMDYLLFSMGLVMLDQIIANIFTILALCSVASFLYKSYLSKDTKLSNEIKRAFNKKLIPVFLLLGLAIPLGILTFFILSIIIFGFYIFSIYTYQLDDIENPLKSARSYSKGAFWRIIGAFIVSSLISIGINYLYQFILDFIWPVEISTVISWYNPSSRRLDLILLYDLLSNLIPILLQPLFICLLTPIFVSIRAKKLLGKGAFYESRTTYTLTEPQISDKGMYCPFCGYYLEFKLNFCPNCGEKLNFKI